MQTPSGSELKTGNVQRAGRAALWNAIFAAMLLWWSLAVLNAPWGTLAPAPFIAASVSVAVYALCVAASFSKKLWLKWLLRLIPWIVLLPLAAECMRGMKLWFNCVISIWNEIHKDGLSLFQTDASAYSVAAVSALAAVAAGQLAWWIIEHRALVSCGIAAAALMLLQLFTNTTMPMMWCLWLSAFIGMWMSLSQQMIPIQTLRMWSAFTALLVAFAFAGTYDEIAGVTDLRNAAEQAVHEFRYGKDTLPSGDLANAAELNKGDTELLKVRSGQRKTIYLRAFEGAQYENGEWQPLTGSAYSGTYAGMLKWLSGKGFDPLTQSSKYYSLCDSDRSPESNTIDVKVTGGSRYYLYVPASAESVSASHKAERDARMAPKGIFGAREYTVQERSLARPSELTVWEEWVADPQTDDQSSYAQSAGMYRSFVYDKYTDINADLKQMINGIFWDDYTTENEGVYSAVQHIRTVLDQRTQYTREPPAAPEGDDAIKDFLTGARRGNSALYASAAVEALRAKGIPARYVEGYYISSDARPSEEDGMISVTSQDAHAWPEVYFDGVGWMPVDVTPGYYYDAVTLSQMVSMPDNIEKTAALDEGPNGGKEVSAMASKQPEGFGVIRILRNTALLLLGIAAAAVLAMSAWYIITRMKGILSKYIKKRRYMRADSSERALLMKNWIYSALEMQGFDACLGWKTVETDAEAAERFEDVEPGEYARVVSLLEKFVYGGEELEAFELRAIQEFYRKIFPFRRYRRGRRADQAEKHDAEPEMA